jgi:hypothetical protein
MSRVSQIKTVNSEPVNGHKKTAKAACLGFLTLLTAMFSQTHAQAQPVVFHYDEITIVCEPSMESAAAEIRRIYPELKQELEKLLSLSLDFKPQVVLVKNNSAFQKLSRNDLFVAFAVPAKNLIVIDYSRMNRHPFTLRITFKHELCHLLLHRHINYHLLPKWFEEGVCQWVSDGIGEIFMDKSWSGLDAAVMAGNMLHLTEISQNFPRDGRSLVLAYEQSKSIVNYIERQYGKRAILDLLNHLQNDESMEAAVFKTIGASIEDLEGEWRRHLETTPRWLVYLADNLYGILFFLAALLTVFGFVRRIMRKRIWEREETDE